MFSFSSSMDFVSACQSMATVVGSNAQLQPDDIVLDVGCGAGDQLLFWQQKYGIKSLKAIEPVYSLVLSSRSKAGFAEIMQGIATDLPVPDNSCTKLLSVDSAYHYDSRTKFFEEANRVLKQDGIISAVDAVIDCKSIWGLQKILSFAMGIPLENFGSMQMIQQQLLDSGFEQVLVSDLSTKVLPGFAFFACISTVSCLFSASKRWNILKWIPILILSLLLFSLWTIGCFRIISYHGKKPSSITNH